jgi:HK97 gp10 family phage protein
MAKFDVKIKGLDTLVNALKERTKAEVIRQIVNKNTAELQTNAKIRTTTAYTGHWEGKKFVKPTGATRQGIHRVIGPLSGTVGMTKEYNPYLEKGTRFMKARPVLKPAFEEQKVKFKADLDRVMK